MFKLFRNRKKYREDEKVPLTYNDFENLKLIIQSLPKNYHFLIDKITSKLLAYKYKNESLGKNWFSFAFNAEELKVMENLSVDFPSRRVSNLLIELVNESTNEIELFFLDKGILGGYKLYFETDLKDLNIKKVHVDRFNEKIYVDKEIELFKNKLKENISNEIINYLDIQESFFINSFDKKLRTIKYFGNGDYLCVDEQLNIFKAYHGKFKLVDTNMNIIELKKVERIKELIEE